VNIEGEPLWAHRSRRRLQIYVGVFAGLFVLLALYDAWTVLVPTALVGALGLIPYFNPTSDSRFQKFLGSRPLPWWVMTWFIAVALTLTAVGTFFRGPGWSWVWPWR
jgi:menaquinol-cytochrome c reductase cytochrome b/c subunit